MLPGAYGKGGRGQRISYGLTQSPIGRMLVAATEKGVCALRFGQQEEVLQELRSEFPNAQLERDEAAVARYAEVVLEYLSDRTQTVCLPLDVQASDFQQRVWTALQQIPAGEKRSYTEVAASIGQPGAARAVARACAANPVALAIPCHRVVRATGALGGFRWGTDRKATLLERENSSTSRRRGWGENDRG